MSFNFKFFNSLEVIIRVGAYTASVTTISSPGLHILIIAKATALKPVDVKKVA